MRVYKRLALPVRRGHSFIIQWSLIIVVCILIISDERHASSANTGSAPPHPPVKAHPKGVQDKRAAVSEHAKRVKTSSASSQTVLSQNMTTEAVKESILSVVKANKSELGLVKPDSSIFGPRDFDSGRINMSIPPCFQTINSSICIELDHYVPERRSPQREVKKSKRDITEQRGNDTSQVHQSREGENRAQNFVDIPEQEKVPVRQKAVDIQVTPDTNIPREEAQTTQTPSDDPNFNAPVYEKDVYRNIAQGLRFYINSHSMFRYLCPSECDNGDHKLSKCSCRPSCVGLGTCCFDYFETCANKHGKPEVVQHRFAWLRDVEKTCTNGRIHVSSCRVDAIHNQKEGEEEQRSLNKFHNDFQENGGEDDSSRTTLLDAKPSRPLSAPWPRPLIVKELLKSLTIDLQQNRQDFDFIEQVLISNPITDMKTSITYKNISIFVCNGGDIDDSKLWNVVFNKENFLIDLEKLTSPYSLYLSLKALNMEAIDPLLYIYRPPKDILALDYCTYSGVNSCPENYSDDTVAFLCSRIYLPVLNMNTKNPKVYGNAFCFLCNEGEDITPSLTTYSTLIESYTMSIEIDFEVSMPYISVTTDPKAGTWTNVLLWKKVLCLLQRNIHSPSINSSWNGSTDNGTNQTTEKAVKIHRQQQDLHNLSSVTAVMNSETQVRKNVVSSSNASDGGLQAWDQHEPAPNLYEAKGIIPVCRIADPSKPCRWNAQLQDDSCVLNVTVIVNLPIPARPVTMKELDDYVFSLSRFFEKLIPTAQFSSRSVKHFQELLSNLVFESKIYIQYQVKVYISRFTDEQKKKTRSFLQTLNYPYIPDQRHVCLYVTEHPFSHYTKSHLCTGSFLIRLPEPDSNGNIVVNIQKWNLILFVILCVAMGSG